jgi:hypothetical protein
VVLKYHRDALEGCGTAAKSASAAYNGIAGTVTGGGLDQSAFGQLPNAKALADAVTALKGAAGEAARTLGGRLEAVERALDSVEQTFTGADGTSVRR